MRKRYQHYSEEERLLILRDYFTSGLEGLIGFAPAIRFL